MTLISGTTTFIDNFDRAQILTTTPGQNGWTIADTSSAGAPTYLTATEDGGKMVLTLANDTEVENICMFQNDVLMYDLRLLQKLWFIAKVAGITSTTVLSFGLGSARNDDEDVVAESAYFKMEGATSTTAVVVETDDATNEQTDVATGKTLAAVYKKFEMDFTQGLDNVRFAIDGDRVASATTFDMSDATAGQNVQPIIQVSKTSAAGVAAIHIAQIGIQYKYSYGA